MTGIDLAIFSSTVSSSSFLWMLISSGLLPSDGDGAGVLGVGDRTGSSSCPSINPHWSLVTTSLWAMSRLRLELAGLTTLYLFTWSSQRISVQQVFSKLNSTAINCE